MDSLHYATQIVNRLTRAGHIAYFAGGWVRDYVMGHPSQDIDIATSAAPVEVMNLFPHTVLVGLHFGVVIVTLGGFQFEVATFRKDLRYIDGRHPEGIEMSNPLEDALRRDFTINGMFYDPAEGRIHDFVHGVEDIKRGVIRTIGNPQERFDEDRLRMLRAFRFSARFGFAIEQETQDAIHDNAERLFPAIAWERVWQELCKMAAYPRFDQAIVGMHRVNLLSVIFPELLQVHLKEIQHIVSIYKAFPPHSPTILYLMELFPGVSLDKKKEIAMRLTAPGRALRLMDFFDQVQQAVERGDHTPYTWAHIFAHPDQEICLHVIAAHYPDQERQQFLQEKDLLARELSPHVQRLKAGQRPVSSDLLKQNGILPGPKMGLLLKEAEVIAINQNLTDSDAVLQQLMQNPLWSL